MKWGREIQSEREIEKVKWGRERQSVSNEILIVKCMVVRRHLITRESFMLEKTTTRASKCAVLIELISIVVLNYIYVFFTLR